MSNNELLLAISDLMDAKLEPIRKEIQDTQTSIQTKLDILDAKIDGVEASLNARMDALEIRIDTVEARLNARIDAVEARLDARIDALDAKIDAVEASLKADINVLDAKIDDIQISLDSEIRRTNILIETEILPRLNSIESTYMYAYDKYSRAFDDMESLKSDMSIVKGVLSEHSRQLKRCL